MIDIAYTISKPEYIEAQKLFIKRRRRKSLYLRLTLYAFLIIVCAYSLFTAKGEIEGASVFVGTAVFLVLAVIVLNRSLQKFFLLRRFATESRFLTGVHVTMDDDSFRGSIDRIGESVTQWTAFTGWVEGPTVFALIAGLSFRPIPKRVLSPEQQTELRDLLERHITIAKSI